MNNKSLEKRKQNQVIERERANSLTQFLQVKRIENLFAIVIELMA